MKLTGWKLLVALWVFMGASSFILSPIAKAADAAPGEGAYLGAFVGMGSGVISPKVQVFDLNTTQFTDATFEATNGGFGLSGVEGGGWFGYGIKTADDLYIGLDGSFAASDNKIELQSSVDLTDGETSGAISTASAERQWVGTGALRVGYYVNPSTLFSLSGASMMLQLEEILLLFMLAVHK